jgi:cbb3-type cytochrome oxidase subunit 3
MYQWLYQDNPYRAFPLIALVVFLVFFAGTFVWAYWPRGARRFDAASALPLGDDDHGG